MSKELKSVGQTYVTGAKPNEKRELQLVGLTTELTNAFPIKPGDYYEQPAHWMKAYDKVIDTKKAQMTEVYEDEIGSWVTILEPITDGENNIVAIVAADLDASIVPITKEVYDTGLTLYHYFISNCDYYSILYRASLVSSIKRFTRRVT